VVADDEELVLKANSDSSMVMWTQSTNKQKNIEGWWTKYFCYNKRTKAFYHFKNCRIVNNQEECKIVQY
jgi:hypothetical protein